MLQFNSSFRNKFEYAAHLNAIDTGSMMMTLEEEAEKIQQQPQHIALNWDV